MQDSGEVWDGIGKEEDGEDEALSGDFDKLPFGVSVVDNDKVVKTVGALGAEEVKFVKRLLATGTPSGSAWLASESNSKGSLLVLVL